MKFVQFPNGLVWRVFHNKFIEGTVRVPAYEEKSDLEARLDAIAEAATGSSSGLVDFSYQFRGNDLVTFGGTAAELPDDEDDYADEGYLLLEEDSDALHVALAKQYGLSEAEVNRVLANLDTQYGPEDVLEVLGSSRQLHTPRAPAECSYVRVTLDGLELGFWTMPEWEKDPSAATRALLNSAAGR